MAEPWVFIGHIEDMVKGKLTMHGSCSVVSDSLQLRGLHQAPLSIKFSRQEYWNGLPFPTPGNLPDPGIEPTSLVSPAL